MTTIPIAPATKRTHVAPLGLRSLRVVFHERAPVATTCRPVGTRASAAKRRHVVAMGVSPWVQVQSLGASPEGTTGGLSSQFKELSRLEKAINSNLKALGFALPKGAEK